MANTQITDAVTQSPRPIQPGDLDAADMNWQPNPNYSPDVVDLHEADVLDKDEDADS